MSLVLGCCLSLPSGLNGQSVLVIRTASTNTPEVRITAATHGRFETPTQQRLWAAIRQATPLNDLPVAHCIHSMSFGTHLFVEVDGVRSPDLSCPHQPDQRAALLQAEALQVLAANTKRKK